MIKKAFFSFHYKNDVNRANVARNSWITKDRESRGFIDKAEFEKIQRVSDQAVRRWIDEQLQGTSVTVVLIGEETFDRPYVKYEIEQSYKKGNALIGVKIGGIKDMVTGRTSSSQSSVKIVGNDRNGNHLWFDEINSGIYDYNLEDGYNNLGKWIMNA
ncbi:molecular chaperone Tir [Marinococcus halophilus]|uniref:Thoeris protein ThsB TIR-like domain-containing protein n=1 Tax=Marinococcus halophilus TaxID=1371 RepID=A0A510Y9Q0_MARHA|nr:TIR domain-containing protein [Marinococcus halophilus]OZT78876.1 molecular chaperone Tir [Marinococcus halophilus]GEK60116.1 hypothetical protein MHA01_30210 [Marinococcus halophilus]